MNFDELQKIWSQQPVPRAQDPAAETALLQRVRDDAARFERKSLHSDSLVFFIYVLVGVVCSWIAYVDSSPLGVLSAVAFLPVAIYVILFRIKNRLPPARADAPLTQVIERALTRLRQRRRFAAVCIWVCWGSVCLSRLFSRIHSHLSHPSAEQTHDSVLTVALVLLLGALMFLMTRRYIKTEIDPQIAELETQQRILSGETEPTR
jgi:hypothetical protein